MILEQKTDTLLMEDGEVQESTNMEIDADSHIFLMRMLSKFYSDGIGSLIRETCSNALDSHRQCGVDEPIIVSFLENKDRNYEFSVQDFGCGLDNNDVNNIIKKYGKSTKRQSVNQLGAFGLGFKSPLAYTSSFYFIGIKGGIERKWMLYESDDESNKIDLLYESPTEERNGVKVIVPVKYGDRSDFQNKIAEQLAYFENVYFNCPSAVLNDNVKIIRHEHFQWSNLVRNSNLHICLDNVYYSIDFDKLGISRISFPVGLRFSLTDGLFPVPNREQLKYTKEAKEIILKKIKDVADYFVSKYNESIKDTTDILSLLDFYKSNSRYIDHLNPSSGKLDVQCLEYYSSYRFEIPELKGVKFLNLKRIYDLKDYLFKEYEVKYEFNAGRFNAIGTKKWNRSLYFNDIDRQTVYIYTEMEGLKKAYLRDTINNIGKYKRTRFVRKENKIPLGDYKSRYTGRGYDNYINLLSLLNHPRNEWRDRIKECQYVVSLLTSNFVDVDRIVIPQEWIENRKKKRVVLMAAKGTNVRKKKLVGEITGKVASPLEKYVSGKNCKWVPEAIKMSEAHKNKRFIVYGNSEKEPLFQKLYTILRKRVTFVIFSERELQNLKDIKLHNWMEIDKFMEGKHKVYKRAVTAYLISKLYDKYNSVFDRTKIVYSISSPLGEKMKTLSDYMNQYHLRGDEELFKAMLKVAEENNLFDTSVYDIYKEVKFILEQLPFIHYMFSKMSYSDDIEPFNCIRDLFKYYKQRINWEHYTLPINEEMGEKEIETITN